MQAVRQRLNIGPEVCNALTGLFNKSPRPTFRSRQSFLSSLEIRRQQSHALIDVVVQFSGNPRTFLFVSFNQSAAYARKGFLSQFTLGNVQNLPDKISRLDRKSTRLNSSH